MAIIVDNDTRLVVQGLTGREGSFHGVRNRDYGTDVVAGVRRKGGADVEGIPVFDTVAEAVTEAGANTAMVFVPARFATDAVYESVDAGIETVICIAEGLPAHEMLRVYNYIRPKGITMLGPNCPGALSPGKANVGIIPAEIFREGRIGSSAAPARSPTRSATSWHSLGLGNSTIVGIGGDPVVGSGFIDVLAKFEADEETEIVVMVGEIGGAEEEKAAEYIKAEMTKPVVAYIAARRPRARRWATPARSSPAPPARPGEEGSPRGLRRPGRHDADRGRTARRRRRRRTRLNHASADIRRAS